jgi:hypothetical protein
LEKTVINSENRNPTPLPPKDIRCLFKNLLEFLINHETEGEQEFRLGQWIETLDDERIINLYNASAQIATGTGEDIPKEELKYIVGIAITALLAETKKLLFNINEETLLGLFTGIRFAAKAILLKRRGYYELGNTPSIQDDDCKITWIVQSPSVSNPEKIVFAGNC